VALVVLLPADGDIDTEVEDHFVGAESLTGCAFIDLEAGVAGVVELVADF